MKRIHNFNEFVNEGYLSKIASKFSGWIDSLKKAVVKIIPSGPKAGKPMAVAFDPDNGSIESQLLSFFSGTPYAEAANEAKVPLEFPRQLDVLNIKETELKRMIKTRLKDILSIADKQESGELNPEEAYKQACLVKPIFIFGAPGIGKTQIVSQVCDELGAELFGKPLNMAFVDGEFAEPVDFAGVPSVVDIAEPSEQNPYGKGITRSNVSVNLLPSDNGRDNMGGILFIDELNRMPQEVIKVFMKLAQSRRLGQNYQIPLKWYIVAAGNRPEDDPREVKPMGTALRDRFSVVNFVTSPKSYRKYIEGSERYKDLVLPELLDFLEFQEDYFHHLDPSKQMMKFPTPRAWTDASVGLERVMRELKSEGVDTISEEDMRNALQLEVGYEAAAAFIDFYRVAKEIPVKDLLLPFTNPDKAPLPDAKDEKGKKRADYAHALLSGIMRMSKDMTLTEVEVCNFAKYLTRVGSPEWGGAALSSLVSTHPYIFKKGQPKYNSDVASKASACIGPIANKWSVELGANF